MHKVCVWIGVCTIKGTEILTSRFIMTTMRSITEDGKWAPKSRAPVYDLDEQGKRIFQKVNKQGRGL